MFPHRPFHVQEKTLTPESRSIFDILWLESKSRNWTVWIVLSIIFFISIFVVTLISSREDMEEFGADVDSLFPQLAYLFIFISGSCSKKRIGSMRLPFIVIPVVLLLPSLFPSLDHWGEDSILDIYDNYPGLIYFSTKAFLSFLAGYFFFRSDGQSVRYVHRFKENMTPFPEIHDEGNSFYSNSMPMILVISIVNCLYGYVADDWFSLTTPLLGILFVIMMLASYKRDKEIPEQDEPYGKDARTEGWLDGILHEISNHKIIVRIHLGTLRDHYGGRKGSIRATFMMVILIAVLVEWYLLPSTRAINIYFSTLTMIVLMFLIIPLGAAQKTREKLMVK